MLANEMLADKLSVLSKRMIFRRAKDMVDIYALAHCISVDMSSILEVISKNPNREIGSFNEFYNCRPDIEHAYNRLKGIDNKPPFDTVYRYLLDFVQPFANMEMKPKTWNSSKQRWEDSPTRKPSIRNLLAAAQLEVDEHKTNHRKTQRNKHNHER